MVLILSVVWKSWKDYTSLIQYFLVLQVDTMLVDSSDCGAPARRLKRLISYNTRRLLRDRLTTKQSHQPKGISL
jgi:hypothetical protein